MPRVLLIAEAANPEWVSVPLIGWSLARAISARTATHLVTQVRNRSAIVRAGLQEGIDFTAIDSERIAAPLWKASDALRGGQGVGWTTVAAATTLSYYYFEHLVWKRFGDAITRGEFEIVHRITPLSPTTPSILAKRCARNSIPFILGPLNGGVPWPEQFEAARRKEREWLSHLRAAHRLLPGYRATRAYAAAIIVGSRFTLAEVPERFRGKCVYLPENAVDPAHFSGSSASVPSGTVRGCFVGRLVPYKGPDMLLEAVAPLVQTGRLHLDIIGDGPLMTVLRKYVRQHRLEGGVKLHGWIAHAALPSVMRESQLFLFPSIREFGGGVVLEAMALGIVPVVVDYAGPGELVTEAVGYKIPLGERSVIVQRFRSTVASICDSPRQLVAKSLAARRRVYDLFTWEVKAAQITEIYDWVQARRRHKPHFFVLDRS